MSYEETLKSISLDADATIAIYTGVPGQPGSAVPNAGKQYCGVKVTGAHQVGLAASGAQPAGVLQNKPQTPGSAATVGISGVTNVRSGGAIAAGNYLTTDASGRFVATGTGGTVVSNLQALDIAAGADELIPALFV